MREGDKGYDVSGIRITYEARPDATPESEREVLATVYAFVLRTHQERQKTSPPCPAEDAEGNLGEPGTAPVAHDV